MGIFNALMTYGKARATGRIMRGALGGKFGTALMLAYLGKKAYGYYRTRKARVPARYPA